MNIKVKSVISCTLATGMLMSVAACSGNIPAESSSATSSAESTEQTTTEEEEELWTMPPVQSDVSSEGTIIRNGFFEDTDISMFAIECGSSKISAGSDANEASDLYPNYGVIDRDPASSSPYDCFAQDVTSDIQNGVTYNYEFYAKLSSDYEGAPSEQCQIDFAPYLTVDGQTNYLGSYSSEITGASSQQLKAGEWMRFAGTFTPQWSGNLDKAVIRIIEQGTDYGSGTCVKGDYYIAGLILAPDKSEEEAGPAEVETDIPDLSSAVASEQGLGKDAVCGVSIVQSELSDEKLMQIVTKHFNAITIGNELKPDAMFGYNNNSVGKLEDAELNGETMTVPVLDHTRADAILDKISEWNSANPDKQIKVRGHVLLWHSQTPEWFFHEDYSAAKDYVSKDEMNKRLEWYIKSMMEYYTGPDSKYKDMFYGWDVVNEAISDNTNTYRTHEEPGSDKLTDATHGSKSSWWKVYGSNEFIINAFKFANKYAPSSLELYYNDYNECNTKKCEGIVKLIKDVKAVEGTRIDGFGMQGHYTVNSPSPSQIEACAREYAKVVDKVMLTEFDVKTSAGFDGSKEKLPEEYNLQAVYINQMYEVLKNLDAEDGVDISGITVWGVIDPHSWLQSSNNVGGAANGATTQYPLLFDGRYQAKLSYWAFTDPSKLNFDIKKMERPTMDVKKGTVKVDGKIDDAWKDAPEVPLEIVLGAKCTGTAKLLWDKDNLYVLFDVKDDVLNKDNENAWEQDSIEVFIDENNSKAGGYEPDDKQYRISYENFLSFNGDKCLEENMKSKVKLTDDGYIVEASFKWTDIKPEEGTSVGLELQVNDAGSSGSRLGTISWADDTGTGYQNPEVFGTINLVK
ncbi:MAG: endo-1,4-beta-xylanase [Clostridiales bacterium]|nr:endo-1,4-beta-xylanase [Clostridiales bacterium]